MLLNKIFKDAPEIEIEQLSVDSRLSMKNAIFFCLDGIKYDGHDYIKEAIDNGAKVIIYSKPQDVKYKAIYIQVKNVTNTMIKVADIFYNHPNSGIDKYIIMGNYGRSSVAKFINHYLNTISTCGYVGILGVKYNDILFNSSYPTLNSLDNLKILDTLKKANIKSVTFEASPSALNLQKLDCVKPEYVIYTCTDKTSSEYQSSDFFTYIRRYLYTLENDTTLILNIDDESFNELNDSVDNYVTYGVRENANYRISDIKVSKKGIEYDLTYQSDSYHIESKLQGKINVFNLTAAIVALHQKGYDMKNIIDVFKNVNYVDGVMEKVDEEYNIIVDCAYDIDSIEEICKYASVTKNNGKSIGVFSINYSDDDKRLEKIINILDKYMDVIILTEDESLDSEIMDILERCNKFSTSKKVLHISVRSLAIEEAIEIMNKNDVMIIVGKGNERYLSMGLGKEFYYGDKYYAKKYLEKRRREENEII